MQQQPRFVEADLAHEAPKQVCQACAAQAMYHEPTESAFIYCRHAGNGAARILGKWRVFLEVPFKPFHALIMTILLEGEARFLERQADAATRH